MSPEAELAALLQSDLPEVTLDHGAHRRLSVVREHLYTVLTALGSDLGALAPLFLSERYDALVAYLLPDGDESLGTAPVLLRFPEPPSLATFTASCLLRNAPAVFPVDLDEPLFKHMSQFVTEAGEPDVRALAGFFPAGTTATVVDCSQADQPREQMTLASFADSQAPSLYMRDLHLVAAAPETFTYQAPALFAMDWPSLCFDGGLEGASDMRFVYCSASTGTSTPCHCDVMNTYSWSVSLCGVKHWQMWPPVATPMLYDVFGQRLAPWPRHADTSRLMWPRAHAAPCIEFTQLAGEAVFVPSGWRHTVVNAGPGVLSVNANWFNAFNVHWVLHHICIEQRGSHEAREKVARMLSFVRQHTLQTQTGDTLLAALTLRRCEQALAVLGHDRD